MKKFALLFALLFTFISTGFAQFKYGTVTNTNKNIGQTLVVDSVNGKPTGTSHFTVHFNSNIANSYYNAAKIFFGKCQTQKGLQVNAYPDSAATSNIKAGDFKCETYGSNGNPVHVSSTDSLIAIMKEFTRRNATTADSAKNKYYLPAACLFDVVKGDTTDLAFGCYPGKYKRVEYGFQFDFSAYGLASDLSFDINTYDQGNTGKTASYDLLVFLGSVSAATAVDTLKNFYVTGSGKKTVNLAEALGISYSAFSTKKVFFFLKTQGTGTNQVEGIYDPIIVFDNFQVSWGTPKWTSPTVTADQNYNNGGTGIYSPYTLEGTAGTIQLYLKDEGRVSALKLTNDVEAPPSKYQFLETGGVFANDGNGNYTVPVSYTFTPSVQNTETFNYSKSYIQIPVPSSATSDDLMVLMKFTPKADAETIERVEINNGVRFWWDVQTKSVNAMNTAKDKLQAFSTYASNGIVYINGAEGLVSLYNLMGQKLGTYASDVAAKGIVTPKGLLIVSTVSGAVKVLVP
ncbi:MAG: hypothetical protein Q8914_13825 [Bacteroidota bacterium]|nr:hypothetical protein [Bacteroidota bacterium]